FGGGGFGIGGFGGGGIFSALAGPVLSLAGRAAGGSVSEGRPFLVGERGPELFVPDRAGRIAPSGAPRPMARPGGRTVNITVNVNGAGSAPAIRQSAAQVAVAVRRALARAERDL
ncbi:MAG: tail tape measure protein, partial [Alphaproteobacteria bacterium]